MQKTSKTRLEKSSSASLNAKAEGKRPLASYFSKKTSEICPKKIFLSKNNYFSHLEPSSREKKLRTDPGIKENGGSSPAKMKVSLTESGKEDQQKIRKPLVLKEKPNSIGMGTKQKSSFKCSESEKPKNSPLTKSHSSILKPKNSSKRFSGLKKGKIPLDLKGFIQKYDSLFLQLREKTRDFNLAPASAKKEIVELDLKILLGRMSHLISLLED
jgi:hypothetical protein